MLACVIARAPTPATIGSWASLNKVSPWILSRTFLQRSEFQHAKRFPDPEFDGDNDRDCDYGQQNTRNASSGPSRSQKFGSVDISVVTVQGFILEQLKRRRTNGKGGGNIISCETYNFSH